MKNRSLLSSFIFVLSFTLLFSQEVNLTKNNVKKADSLTAKSSKNKNPLYGKNGKQYRDMSVQLFVGQPAFMFSTLNTIPSDLLKVYDVQFGYTYQFTHSFGVQLKGQMGKARAHYPGENDATSETNYSSLYLMGDFNITSLFRRLDLRPTDFYKWALHAYGGIGTLIYKTDGLIDKFGAQRGQPYEAKAFQGNYAAELGVGIRRRISKSFDVELKQTVIISNDKTFDGAGSYLTDNLKYNNFVSGNLFVTSLGVHYKIGRKNAEHLNWIDPLNKVKSDVIRSIVSGEGLAEYKGLDGMAGLSGLNGFNGISAISGGSQGKVCGKDSDDDGVCDDWDRELTTPVGARVDGSGTSLDVDKDGVIDLFDQCVVTPGEGNPTGCPDKQTVDSSILIGKLASINLALEGIDFDFNSAIIKPTYFTILDQAAFVMNEFPSYQFNVQGHTDASGSDYYNYVLSKKRAESVKTYLMEKHKIALNRLIVDPKGETELKNQECQPYTKCDENKNRENRRIVFVPVTK